MIDWMCVYIAMAMISGAFLGYCVRATRTEEMQKQMRYFMYSWEDYKKEEKIKTLEKMVVNLQEEIQKITGELE